jgi:hypothetical protein
MSYQVTRETRPSGYTVEVWTSEDACNPRKEWDNLGTVVLHDRCRYDFGDDTASNEELQELAQRADLITLPVYMYDHSGITINTSGFSCPWDSGMVGLIYVAKAKALKEWGGKILTAKLRAKVLECLRAEIKTLDGYITGQVYGWKVIDPEGEEIDSCWGYYNELEYCLSEGMESAKYSEAQATEVRA